MFMKVMNLQPQQKPNTKRTGKRITFFKDQGVAMKEASQHTEASAYYGIGVPPPGPGTNESGLVESSSADAPHLYHNSVIFSPEKAGDQTRGHYQQAMPMKWTHQDSSLPLQQRPNTWSQDMSNWPQNFNSYSGATRQSHEGVTVPEPPKQGVNVSGDNFREMTKTVRNLDWDQQQSFQQTPKAGMLNPNAAGNSVLQPFQLAFGQQKQVAGYYQVVQGNRTLPNLNYSMHATPQHQLHLQEQKAQMQRQMMLQQQQQHQHQHQVLQHHKQSRQILQAQMQQIQQDLLQQQLKSEPPGVESYPDAQKPPALTLHHHQTSTAGQSRELTDPLSTTAQDSTSHPSASVPHSVESQQPGPRRSRRVSKEGGGRASDSFTMPAAQSSSQNGGCEADPAEAIRAAPTGVIQSTRRKRRGSQEVNLETLAQKASEREFLPSRGAKEPHRPWSPKPDPGGGAGEVDQVSAKRPRDDSLVPLVIPVSVPVRQASSSPPLHQQHSPSASWPTRTVDSHELSCSDYKTSVIVKRRRSLRNSVSESSGQNGGTDTGSDTDNKSAKAKRRPRPEPLFIPPPKPSTFIAPPVYSSITPYQSHLRSPVRLADNPLTMPPYTPPPILSPVREGSGLYFTTFLSAAVANNQGLPPPATPKSAARSLLRSNSSDITPPVLSAMSEATPVSIEP